MISKSLYFNTVNASKQSEISEIFVGCDVKFMDRNVVEILDNDIESVIKAKAAEAYKLCRVPIIVEHGALLIKYLNEFPGALSKPMWDLMNDKICHLIPKGEDRSAIALSGVCYCDGITRQVFIGETSGSITEMTKGTGGFQWDPIFIPDGSDKTYAEMSQTEKLRFSQAKKAYDKLKTALKINV